LISPQAVPNTDANKASALQPAVSYILSYGGGIVHGDQIHADVRSGTGCALMLLTQGSTKVYKHRAGRPPSYLENKRMNGKFDINQTYQTLLIDVEPGALVCLLPDPVTCFKGALYNQRQAVRLHDTSSSLILLDWMTSGRMSRGERWEFEKYFSVNVVCLGTKERGQRPASPRCKTSKHDQWMGDSQIIIRDALLLQDPPAESSPPSPDQLQHAQHMQGASFARRLKHIDVFAYLIILGPAVASVAHVFRDEHQSQRIRPFRPNASTPDAEEAEIRWSVSDVEEHGISGVAVRAAGPSTEALRSWIKKRIANLQHIVGDSAWSMYYNA
ncbi:hypothetical protein GGI12_002087, partial [Dipsacomyces acuminosporus]